MTQREDVTIACGMVKTEPQNLLFCFFFGFGWATCQLKRGSQLQIYIQENDQIALHYTNRLKDGSGKSVDPQHDKRKRGEFHPVTFIITTVIDSVNVVIAVEKKQRIEPMNGSQR
jgi:hypothetical protein